MRHHFAHPYLAAAPHKITVDLVGVGGTGSQVLTGLARINAALMGLRKPGIHVRAWDPDVVTTANLGRQLFSESDLGQSKATVLITRVNRYYGFDWQAIPQRYNGTQRSNITVTCIDTAAGRLKIADKLKPLKTTKVPTEVPYYWLDLGNLQTTGQAVLGSVGPIPQPRSNKATTRVLPNLVKLFPQIKRIKEENQGPSCSLAEALEKQDLFINSTMAQFGCNLLWKLIQDGVISYHGCYVNLETLTVNPIPIK